MIASWAALNPDIEISVFYTDADDQGRGWRVGAVGAGVTEQRLPMLLGAGRYGKLNLRLRRMVAEHNILMIGGFEQASYLVAAAWARLMRKPVILLFDGFSPARFGREPRAVLALKRVTAALTDGFFANGTVGERYLQEQVGVDPAKPVLNQFLSHADAEIVAALARWRATDRQDVRRHLGIAIQGPLLISCGYLVARKGVASTIDAIATLSASRRPGLLVVGSGPLDQALKARAAERGIAAHFTGFLQGTALADHYVAADAMVLASSDDPWGLVINEAMSAGLPVLVSDACGAALDLVRTGENGFLFKSGDVRSLADALEKLLDSDMELMGRRSRALIGEWTPAHSARNLGRMVRAIAGDGELMALAKYAANR